MTKTGLRASASWLGGLLALSLPFLAACSNVPAGGGALHVIVKLEPGTVSQCVIVTATDGTKHGETNKMPVDGQTELDVAILANGMSETVTVQAIGYVDAACTTEALGETSEPTQGRFATPANTITVTISPARPDGGTDAGTDAGMDGGTDAGMDGGVDLDLDGWSPPQDCNDANPNIHPGMSESCTNGLDDDCDQLTDCEDQLACQGRACANGGTCTGTVCVTMTELSCDDRADNDGDQLVDCADPDCTAGTTCSDGDGCTTGDRCVSDGGCESTGSVMCMTPPNLQCWAMGGTCERDAGATCSYTQLTGGCDDGNACTTGESCANGACGGGTATACGAAPTCRGPGTCQPADGGCVFPPLAAGTGSCSDGNNCTVGDTCDGDGGCAPGATVACTPPSQCHQVNAGVCESDGGCTFSSRAGQACDAGMGVTATCNTAFTCVAQGTLFPFVPSNFTEANLADAGTNFNVTGCSATIDTSNTPSISSTCGLVLPAFTLVTQPFGGQAVLFRVADFGIEAGRTLTLTGTRPAIFAATGNINIPATATLRARNAAGTSADCGNGGNGDGSGSGNGLAGGGGGGFGSAGGLGGSSGAGGAGAIGAANGNTSLIPLRGGCNGGAGGATAGGAGGGAVQLVSANALTIGGLITAPGRGGGGAQSGGEGGGGGGSGGGILLEGHTVAFSGIVTANGGGGGEGSGGSNGNPGGDATELIQTGALGGSGGSFNGGNGGSGGARLTTAGDGVDVNNNDGAGGGGGGFGRIRIKGNQSCSLTGTTSPAPDVSCP